MIFLNSKNIRIFCVCIFGKKGVKKHKMNLLSFECHFHYNGKLTLEIMFTSEVEFVHIYIQRKILIWLVFFWTWDRMLSPNSFEGKLLSAVHEPLDGTDCTTCQHLKECQTFNRHPTTAWVNEKNVKCYLCNWYYQFLGTIQNMVPSFFSFFLPFSSSSLSFSFHFSSFISSFFFP